MSEQTAVQWLVEQLTQIDKGCINKTYLRLDRSLAGIHLRELIEKALQMEREQKSECWSTAHQAGRFEGKGIAEENWQTFDQYYEERYRNQNQK